MTDSIVKFTKLAEARWRCLVALSAPSCAIRASSFGYVGFPHVRFRKPQGAAFAGAKLRHGMLADGVVTPHFVSGEYRITQKGRAELAAVERTRHDREQPVPAERTNGKDDRQHHVSQGWQEGD
ncbi:MAG: hypothetical protein ACREPQ_14760 [Rhodanobacter sp.]